MSALILVFLILVFVVVIVWFFIRFLHFYAESQCVKKVGNTEVRFQQKIVSENPFLCVKSVAIFTNRIFVGVISEFIFNKNLLNRCASVDGENDYHSQLQSEITEYNSLNADVKKVINHYFGIPEKK